MPIEIKELLIRAFVGNQTVNDNPQQAEKKEKVQGAQTAQDAVSVFSSMVKQEKER